MIPSNLGAVLANRKKFVDENFASTEGQGTQAVELRCESIFHGTKFIDKSDVGYTGLINQGATCYLNSLLQTLYMIPEFRFALLASNFESSGDDEHNLSKQLQKLFVELQYSEKGALSTSALTKSFGWSGRDSFIQQDVQECMTVIFDFICMQYPDSEVALLLRNEWCGSTQIVLTCGSCGCSRSRAEPFRDLQLQVQGAGDLYQSIGLYLEEEHMDGVDCEACNGRHPHKKQPRFTKLPYILSLQLRRFDMNWATMQRVKVNDALRIYSSLTLQQAGEHVTDAGETKEYQLVSIMMHSGSAHSGHYFAYIRSQSQAGDSRWLLFNDSDVSAVSEEQLAVVLGIEPPSDPSPSPPTPRDQVPSGVSRTSPKTIPSANNAYMLVYREISPVNLWERVPTSVDGLSTDDSIPAELLAAVQRENDIYRQQKNKYDYERAFLHICVSPVLLGEYAKECIRRLGEDVDGKCPDVQPSASAVTTAGNSSTQNRIIRIHESKTLQDLTDMVYEHFCNEHDISPATSASYTSSKSVDALMPLPRLLPNTGLSRDCVRLRAFDSVKGCVMPPTALLPKGITDRLSSETEVDKLVYDQQTLEAETVLSSISDAALRRVMHLEVRRPSSSPFAEGSPEDGVMISMEAVIYSPPLPHVFSAPISFQFPSESGVQEMLHRLYSTAVEEDSTTERCCFEDMVVAIHDISSGVARQIHPRPDSSRIAYHTTLATSLLSGGDRVYVDLHRSLSAPRAEDVAVDRVGLMDYFLQLENAITIYFPDIGRTESLAEEVSRLGRLNLTVDRRCLLEEVKLKMAQMLDRAVDSFILLRGGKSPTDTVAEIKNLSLSLAQNGYDDGSFFLIRPGKPLLPGEFRVQFLLKRSVSSVSNGIAGCELSAVGDGSVLRGDQTVRDVKGLLLSHFQWTASSDSTVRNIRLQLAQKFAPDVSVGAGGGEEGNDSGTQEYFKPTFVLDDEKTLKDCLGSQLKDGVHIAVTLDVTEASFSSNHDLFVSLWQWSPIAEDVRFRSDVVVSKSETFGDLKCRIRELCLRGEGQLNSEDDFERNLAAGNIYFAKPFTWQLKDAASNIPFLKWSNQPEHDGVEVVGPPYRLSNAPLSGPTLLLFKVCAPSALLESGDETSAAAAQTPQIVPHEIGFRLYSMEEQAARQAEEVKLDAERKLIVEERLKSLCQVGVLDSKHV